MIDIAAHGVAILGVLTLAIAIALVRMVIGPSLPDRVAALDAIALIGIAMMIAAAIAFDVPSFLDVALLVALVGFLGTAAFAHFIERGVDR